MLFATKEPAECPIKRGRWDSWAELTMVCIERPQIASRQWLSSAPGVSLSALLLPYGQGCSYTDTLPLWSRDITSGWSASQAQTPLSVSTTPVTKDITKQCTTNLTFYLICTQSYCKVYILLDLYTNLLQNLHST